ncbi:phospholipase A [Modicisalibacter xianhensis]|uniref:Phospholipase A1 n=1 Tax=Modicisalibacter xianhensis TaxID=442341 RepID=A0A1I2ZQD8_9GAMM|nr:phospholipase A [Halomonas xianhensis]SFH39291.1 phospholipase A1 [Halomonas xianhensis]
MALPSPLRMTLVSLALLATHAQAQEDASGLTSRDEAAQAAVDQAETRRELEQNSENNPLAITVYRRNYLLPWTYNTHPNQSDFDGISDDGDADKAELKFQISLKVKVFDDLIGNNGDLYFAYTQRSWWQAYNSEASSPFRETNYEPEAFISFDNRFTFLGWTNTQNRIGYAHQSNGQSEPLSRSWNRLYADFLFQRGDWAVSIAPHWRIPESDKEDDNPDLQDYIGYGDITVVRAFGDHEVSLMVRGNPEEHNYGAQLDYTFPLIGKVRGHVQYYDGYGESLIDHDQDVQRLGIGFSLNTFLAGVPGTQALVR